MAIIGDTGQQTTFDCLVYQTLPILTCLLYRTFPIPDMSRIPVKMTVIRKTGTGDTVIQSKLVSYTAHRLGRFTGFACYRPYSIRGHTVQLLPQGDLVLKLTPCSEVGELVPQSSTIGRSRDSIAKSSCWETDAKSLRHKVENWKLCSKLY